MKKNFFSILFLGLALITNAQLRKIPADVTDAFANRYPHATKVEWRDKLQYFEATFQLNGSTLSADFSSKGDWQRSEHDLNFDDLPAEVKDGFQKSKYSNWQTKSVTEVQNLGDPLEYKLNVQKTGLQKKNLLFNANGKLLKENITL